MIIRSKCVECANHWLKEPIMYKIIVVDGKLCWVLAAPQKWSHEISNRRSNHVKIKMQIYTHVIIMQNTSFLTKDFEPRILLILHWVSTKGVK